jgi:quercetin dioxygenase-like cupin family protein
MTGGRYMFRIEKLVSSLAAVVVLTWTAAMFGAGEKDAAMKPSLRQPETLQWRDGPPSLPPGAKIAVLEGNPTKEGPFVFRVKVPDGYRVPPHTHPKTERVTVISGTFNIGMGDKFDEKATEAMPAGTYGYWEAGMHHFVWAKGETVVQFHGTGPWSIEYLDPKDDPRNQRR